MSNTGNVDLRSLPTPDDATPEKEYRFYNLQYLTTRGLDEMITFYRDELGDLGWTETGESEDKFTPSMHSLYFERDLVNINVSLSWDEQEKTTTVGLSAYLGP